MSKISPVLPNERDAVSLCAFYSNKGFKLQSIAIYKIMMIQNVNIEE